MADTGRLVGAIMNFLYSIDTMGERDSPFFILASSSGGEQCSPMVEPTARSNNFMGHRGERGLAVLFLVPFFCSLPAAAAEPKVVMLEPSGPWSVHYADDFCRLSRSFGEGEQQIFMIMDRFGPGASFRLILAGQPMESRASDGTAYIRFGSALPQQKIDYFSGDVGETVPAWVFGRSTRIRPYPTPMPADGLSDGRITADEEASVTAVHIGRPLRHAITLDTGSMKGAFAALRRCTDELLSHWGIDVARHRTLLRGAIPIGAPGDWLVSSDYPQHMLAKSQPGMVQFRLIVGEDGQPTACHIQQSTKPDGFDDAVCKALMRRARFEPALDGEGKPMTSAYINEVVFKIH